MVGSRYTNREEAKNSKQQRETEPIRSQSMMKRYFYLVLTSAPLVICASRGDNGRGDDSGEMS